MGPKVVSLAVGAGKRHLRSKPWFEASVWCRLLLENLLFLQLLIADFGQDFGNRPNFGPPLAISHLAWWGIRRAIPRFVA